MGLRSAQQQLLARCRHSEMDYSLVRGAAVALNEAALDQHIDEVARGCLVECHTYRQAVDREFLAASLLRNLRQRP